MVDQIITMITLLFSLGVVIFLAYITTVYIGKKTGGYYNTSNSKVLERFSIGLQMNITIVQIQSKVYILLIHNKRVEVIDKIEAEVWFSNSMESNIAAPINNHSVIDISLAKLKDFTNNSVFKKGDDDNRNGT